MKTHHITTPAPGVQFVRFEERAWALVWDYIKFREETREAMARLQNPWIDLEDGAPVREPVRPPEDWATFGLSKGGRARTWDHPQRSWKEHRQNQFKGGAHI